MTKRIFNVVFLIMLILGTVLLIAWHRVGMNIYLPIIKDTNILFNLFDMNDQANGGISTSSLGEEANALTLSCHIAKGEYEYPYCGFVIQFNDDRQGVDLSQYEQISLHLGFQDSPDQKVRVQIKNSNPAYTKPGDYSSEKFNSVEYNPSVEGQLITIPFSYFQVPEWWIGAYKIPIALSMPEFTNVTSIEISTGYNVGLGDHKIWIKELTLSGKWISYGTLVTLILTVWVLSALLMLTSILIRFREAYLQDKKQLRELRDINRALNLHSKKMEQQAKVDPLTGAKNRLGIREELLSLQTKTAKKEMVLSIMFLDIDHFKSINDTYGHAIGDEVLVDVVKLFRKMTRTEDRIVRWGGEEFLLICPQANLQDVVSIAEKIREAFEQHTWPKDIKLTCSFGVGQLHPGESMEGFIHRVDKALYGAKESGRNRVQISYL